MEPNYTRLTVNGDRINYPGDPGTPMTDLLTFKIMLNSIISTTGANFMTMDVNNFYLNTPFKTFEYLCLRMNGIPEDIKKHYKLQQKAHRIALYMSRSGKECTISSRLLESFDKILTGFTGNIKLHVELVFTG